MEKYVFCASEDAMRRNGKTAEQLPALIKTMAGYGTVHKYADYAKTEQEESQKIIDNLTAELNNQMKLSEREKSMVLALRQFVSIETEGLKANNAELAKQLGDLNDFFTNKFKAIGDIIQKKD